MTRLGDLAARPGESLRLCEISTAHGVVIVHAIWYQGPPGRGTPVRTAWASVGGPDALREIVEQVTGRIDWTGAFGGDVAEAAE